MNTKVNKDLHLKILQICELKQKTRKELTAILESATEILKSATAYVQDVQDALTFQFETSVKELQKQKLELDDLDFKFSESVKDLNVVKLNVGGQYFTTSKENLVGEPGTFFSVMFSGRWNVKLNPDDQAVFIDRSPHVFDLVMNHLRGMNIQLSSLDPHQYEDLLVEAEFYQIHSLVNLLQAYKDMCATKVPTYQFEDKLNVCLKEQNYEQLLNLVAHCGNKTNASLGLEAIVKIVVSSTKSELFGKIGACKVIVQITTFYKKEVDVCVQSCRAILNLACTDENRVLLNSSRACDLLVEVLNLHINNARVVIAGCGAVRRLAAEPDNRVTLDKAGICMLLIQVLNLHKQNRDVAEEGCLAVYSLAENLEVKQKLLKSIGVIEMVINNEYKSMALKRLLL